MCRDEAHAGAHAERRRVTRQIKRLCLSSAARALNHVCVPSVVDVCCGRGQIINALRDTFASRFTYVGIDASEQSLIEFARRASKEILMGTVRLIHGDGADEASRLGQCADLVLCLYAIHYFEDLGAAVHALASCCRPGAVVIIMHADADTILQDSEHVSQYCAKTDTYVYNLPPLVVNSTERRVPTPELCACARQSGLELCSTCRLDNFADCAGITRSCDVGLRFFRVSVFRRCKGIQHV